MGIKYYHKIVECFHCKKEFEQRKDTIKRQLDKYGYSCCKNCFGKEQSFKEARTIAMLKHNPYKGKVHSEETRLKKKQPKSEEHKRKLKIARNNRGPFSEETKLKISLNNSNRIIHECPQCGEKIGGKGNFNKHTKNHLKILEIENLITKYFFVSEFKKNHPELHKFIVNNLLQKKYFSNLQNGQKVILLDINTGVFYFGYEEAVSSCSLTISPYNLMKMTNNYKDNTTSLIKV